MSFKAAVVDVLGDGAFHKGLGALKPGDADHVSSARPRELSGSADVDTALVATLSNAHRWDYVVGKTAGNVITAHWIEVHPASSTKNIAEVERKLAWLSGWLHGNPLGHYPKDVVWVASGKSTYNTRSPAIKALAGKGCRFVGGHLML
jgi:membrane protein YqaA with SNARE-associated domain